ncbi:MAG: DUF6062 family protein [Lachnospiraceae bacterium]|nr:DUF6062 family protein [Lachnospiraceae bacterium]
MAEQLYTIPVTEAFETDSECPICSMYQKLENNAIEYTLGPSYMEDDNRAMTDQLGFCSNHIRILYGEKNRLGLALMLKTHTDKTIKDMKALRDNKKVTTTGGFLKKQTITSMGEYVKQLESTCFVCNRIEKTFERYIDTIFHLWKKDPSFQDKIKNSKGFCTCHYGLLYDTAHEKLSKDTLENFIQTINTTYFDNMDRVNDDISWFIDKFDYRYKNEPWKNSKDALPRGIIKTNHTIVE